MGNVNDLVPYYGRLAEQLKKLIKRMGPLKAARKKIFITIFSSSFITQFSWRWVTGDMNILINNKWYLYKGVPLKKADAFSDTPNPSEFYNKFIRRQHSSINPNETPLKPLTEAQALQDSRIISGLTGVFGSGGIFPPGVMGEIWLKDAIRKHEKEKEKQKTEKEKIVELRKKFVAEAMRQERIKKIQKLQERAKPKERESLFKRLAPNTFEKAFAIGSTAALFAPLSVPATVGVLAATVGVESYLESQGRTVPKEYDTAANLLGTFSLVRGIRQSIRPKLKAGLLFDIGGTVLASTATKYVVNNVSPATLTSTALVGLSGYTVYRTAKIASKNPEFRSSLGKAVTRVTAFKGRNLILANSKFKSSLGKLLVGVAKAIR